MTRRLHSPLCHPSDVHCYVLANVLRRPILIYSDETAAAAGLSGVYLPSLWPNPQEQCSRQPLSVLFGWSHFSLLSTVHGEGPASPPLLPLATRSGPLLPRFLSAAEQGLLEQAVSTSGSGGSQAIGGGSKAGSTSSAGKLGGGSSRDAELELLGCYMDAVRLYDNRLGVRLSGALALTWLLQPWTLCGCLTGAWACGSQVRVRLMHHYRCAASLHVVEVGGLLMSAAAAGARPWCRRQVCC